MADITGPHPRPFGVAALMDAVSGVPFPVSKTKLLQERGEREVEFRHGHPERLRVLLLRCGPCEAFASVEDLISQMEDFV